MEQVSVIPAFAGMTVSGRGNDKEQPLFRYLIEGWS
jgi:hypothetical protein